MQVAKTLTIALLLTCASASLADKKYPFDHLPKGKKLKDFLKYIVDGGKNPLDNDRFNGAEIGGFFGESAFNPGDSAIMNITLPKELSWFSTAIIRYEKNKKKYNFLKDKIADLPDNIVAFPVNTNAYINSYTTTYAIVPETFWTLRPCCCCMVPWRKTIRFNTCKEVLNPKNISYANENKLVAIDVSFFKQPIKQPWQTEEKTKQE